MIDKEADMNNQASDGITDAGKDLVLSCIKSQELRDHMRKYLYWPAPIMLALLRRLTKSAPCSSNFAKRSHRS